MSEVDSLVLYFVAGMFWGFYQGYWKLFDLGGWSLYENTVVIIVIKLTVWF